jgi:GT2 family glycosyltransferase
MRMPGVTFSIVSHGQRDLVGRLLGDLQRLQLPALRRLVLTLNIDEPDPEASSFTGWAVTILRNRQPLGFGANHNQAFRHCDTEWFAVLNPDLRCSEDFITPMLASARADDALLAPHVCEADGSSADAVRRLVTPWQVVRRRLGAARPERRPAAFDWIAGMCLLLRSQAFADIGGFDERFFMYCEDADLCLRLQLAGWQVRQVDGVSVTHAAQRASRRSPRHLGWHVGSLLKHWTSAAFWRYWLRRDAFRAGRHAIGVSRR